MLAAIKLERGDRKCTICKIHCQNKKRLGKIAFDLVFEPKFLTKNYFSDEHMKVHEGDLQCEICKIKFTRNSLPHHWKLSHPSLFKSKLISKELWKKVTFVTGHIISNSVFLCNCDFYPIVITLFTKM